MTDENFQKISQLPENYKDILEEEKGKVIFIPYGFVYKLAFEKEFDLNRIPEFVF